MAQHLRSAETKLLVSIFDLMNQIDSNITTILYVDGKNGNNSGNCLDFDNPCKTIQYALHMNELNSNNSRSFNSLKVIIKSGVYILKAEYFYNSTNIVLEGRGDTMITCGNNTPIYGSYLYENFVLWYSKQYCDQKFHFSWLWSWFICSLHN